VKLSQWAKENGLSYRTAWRMFHAGTLPVEAEQLATGTILVKPRTEAEKVQGAALYARVSSSDQKNDLDRQIARLVEYAVRKKLPVVCSVTEIGSGMNGRRAKLMKLLGDKSVGIIVVEHRDRLVRFGFEYLEAALAAQGRQILVVDGSEVKEDLVRDMTEVLTSFCARLYGKRAAANRARRAIEAMEDANGQT
jgi:predicted site-specific integrase-resolvase